MRLLGDFFAGIYSVVFSRRAPSCPKPRASARPQPKSRVFVDIFLRVLLLLICLGIAVTAMLASGHEVLGHAKALDAPHFSAPMAFNNMEEILSVDPAATPRFWRYIVIHHSDTTAGSAQSFDQNHREKRGWNGLAYDFVIGNGNGQGDGEIVAGPRWYAQEAGAHAHSTLYNEHGIGICLVGNFEVNTPTPEQMAALRELVRRLCARYEIGLINIVGHNQIRQGGSTACPGKFFSLPEFRASLEPH